MEHVVNETQNRSDDPGQTLPSKNTLGQLKIP